MLDTSGRYDTQDLIPTIRILGRKPQLSLLDAATQTQQGQGKRYNESFF